MTHAITHAIAADVKGAGGASAIVRLEPLVREHLGHCGGARMPPGQHAIVAPPGNAIVKALAAQRADIFAQSTITGDTFLIDVSLTNPCKTTHITAAAETDGAAASRRKREKVSKYEALVNDARCILPLVVEAGGRTDDSGAVTRLARLALGMSADDKGGVAYARLVARLRTRISVVLWRLNATNLRRMINAVRRRVERGGAFQPRRRRGRVNATRRRSISR